MMSEEENGQSLTISARRLDIQRLGVILTSQGLSTSQTEFTDGSADLAFGADDILSLTVALGSGGGMIALSRVLIAYIRERKKRLLVEPKHGAIRIVAENYSAEELRNILVGLRDDARLSLVDSHGTPDNES